MSAVAVGKSPFLRITDLHATVRPDEDRSEDSGGVLVVLVIVVVVICQAGESPST